MRTLEDPKVGVRVKLAGLWASLMFCYVYGDFFGLFVPGRLRDMIAGNFGPLGPTTQGVLIGVSLLMAVPAVMIFGSLALPATLCRWANALLGIAYTAIMLLTMQGALPFYLVLGVIEVLLSAAIGVYAWRWPRLRTPA
ncbi:MAG: DUF6326 family protein [Luteibacter sp.]